MKRALIIEDNEDNRALIDFILKHHGFTTEITVRGEQGVDAAHHSQPDFILLDIQLPDIDGYEVLRRIRANATTAHIPIIAFTSHAMAGDRQRLLGAGCNGYIEKPFDPLTVVDSIRAVIGNNT